MSRHLVALLVLLGCAAGCGGSSPDDNNKLACDSYRRHVSATTNTFSDLSKGTITTADALAPIRKAQTDLTGDASIATGSLSSQIQALADAFGRLRVDMQATGRTTDAAAQPVLDDIKPIDTACKALGH